MLLVEVLIKKMSSGQSRQRRTGMYAKDIQREHKQAEKERPRIPGKDDEVMVEEVEEEEEEKEKEEDGVPGGSGQQSGQQALPSHVTSSRECGEEGSQCEQQGARV
ncbi:hypothetical protein FRC00_007016 [Tulasnella sp. 408]|nr:hypothetical protein FRC00_007016 [Tulasnella sp. 408]